MTQNKANLSWSPDFDADEPLSGRFERILYCGLHTADCRHAQTLAHTRRHGFRGLLRMSGAWTPILTGLLGIVSGAVGYWITTFWMKPIIQYRDLRMKVYAEFILYAQVVRAEGLSDRMKKLYEDRIIANRRNSAELAACLVELPVWYKRYLHSRGHAPDAAILQLIGLSNTTDYHEAHRRELAIKRALGYRE